MLEQLKIQKETNYQPPHSPTNTNKLQQYFESSSFLQQQQQLAVFIKNLPIINLKQTKSINNLISSLIKQNELVGQKCQQQINLIKQEYLKHDKLIKTNKQLKIQKQRVEKQKKQFQESYKNLKLSFQNQYIKKQQNQSKQRKLQAECTKINTLLKQGNDKIIKLQQFISMLCAEEFKKCQQFLKLNLNYINNTSNVQEFCHNQRKKTKYLTKIKNIVQQFCLRLQRIVKVVSPTVLASQLNTETSNMIQLIQQIVDHEKNKKKRKRTEGSSEKNISGISEYAFSSHKNISFFQGMLQKLTQCASTNNSTKQAFAAELEQVKNNLVQSKNYYENIVKNLKQQFQTRQEENEKKLHLKEQTIKFYEQEVEKCRQSSNSFKLQAERLNQKVITVKRQLQQNKLIIQGLQLKIINLTKSNQNEQARIKQQTQTRIQQLKKMAVIKIEQRDQIIKQFNEKRKKQQSQHQNEIQQLKIKYKTIHDQIQQKQRQLKFHIKNYCTLESQYKILENTQKQKKVDLEKSLQQNAQNSQKLKKKNSQIDQYKQTLASLDHEKNLQAAYIGQLQAKIQTLNNKMKALENKGKAEAANKKQITSMKNTIIQQKQKLQQYESYCYQLKEENQRLKSIVKEMKKQLEQVYIRLSQLKHIEAERERLFMESQNSQRARVGIQKQNEELKFEILKLEAQNKKMQLQLKHFRNIMSRIKFFQEQ